MYGFLGLELESPLVLAPLAGISDSVSRLLAHEKGAALSYTEMVSAKGLYYKSPGSEELLVIGPGEGPVGIQIFGSEPDMISFAAEHLKDRPNAFLDINMGCPVPKVVKTGAGSALIRNPGRALEILKTARKACDIYGKSLTVKTRIGFEDEDATNGKGRDFVKMLAQSGVELIAVHGRTRVQMYHGQSQTAVLAEYREAVRDSKVAFIANGDIKDGQSALEILKMTDADGLMIGRAATGNPWIFDEVRAALEGRTDFVRPSVNDRKEMILREIKANLEYKDEHIAVREMRPSMMAYIKGIPGAARLKQQLCAAGSLREVEEILWNTSLT